jgi:hypothetical protein
MIATLVIALAIQQKDPYRLEVEDPILAFQREIILGVSTKAQESLGLYHGFTVGAVNSIPLGDISVTFGEVEETVRVGNTTWSVKPSVFGDQLGYVLESDGIRNQKASIKVAPNQALENNVRNTLYRQYFVNEKGEILYEEARAVNGKGRFSMQATYGKDSFDLRIEDARGVRTSTVNPGCGIEGLNEMFKPMIKGQDILLKEKTFYVLDPYTGTPQKYVAKVAGRFSGKYSDELYEGRCVEITGPKEVQKAFISYEGVLMKVEATGRYYLHIESAPEQKPKLRHRKDGGR